MSEDDLQSFIAECEWKTRKILRESNKRAKDNAQALAAKDRVGKNKQGTVPREEVQISPTATKTALSPLTEWKGRDKIIRDAHDTIASFPVDKNKLKTAITEGKQQAEEARLTIHPSLSASPFLGAKGGSNVQNTTKQKNGCAFDDDSPGNDEPAMVTRRTIERDFYIMSKKRSKPLKRTQQSMKQSEPTHELKMVVLRKKYRCDDRIMEAKKRRAEHLLWKIKRLKIPNDESSDRSDVRDGDESEASDATSSSDDEGYVHAIHNLVERQVADENARSLKRSCKTVMNSIPILSVKEVWARLDQNCDCSAASKDDHGQLELSSPEVISSRNCQVPSVALHIATKKLELSTTGADCINKEVSIQPSSSVEQSLARYYMCPYIKPISALQVVVNEPLVEALNGWRSPVTVTISTAQKSGTEVWSIEIYEPSSGSISIFTLSDTEFNSMNESFQLLVDQYGKIDSISVTLRNPHIESHCDATKFMTSLRAVLDMRGICGIEGILDIIQRRSFNFHGLSIDVEQEDAPLSMRISECSPYSNAICPGHTAVGKRGIWRLWEPFVDKNSDQMFPIWPTSSDIKYPGDLDNSQASAFIQYKSLGPHKGECVTVLHSLAFESPVLAPYCYAVDQGYISPPLSDHELVAGGIPHVHLPCTSLEENPVESRFDTLLPPPIFVLDPSESENDWKDAPTNADGCVYHRRGVNEHDEDGFRLTTSANIVVYDNTISSVAYGISEKAASPNRPICSPFATHKSDETCTHYLSRKRTSADYHYIAESDGEGTLNEPYLFTTHMSAYKSVFLSRKSISLFHEQDQFLRAAKEAERKKMDLSLKMKAAEELVEERLRERMEKIEQSVKAQEDLAGKSESSVAVEPSCFVDDSSFSNTHNPKIPCDVDWPPQIASSEYSNAHNNDEVEQLVNLLLKNTNFLKSVARKLRLPDEQVMQIDATADTPDSDRQTGSSMSNDTGIEDRVKQIHFIEERVETPTLHQNPGVTDTHRNISKLKLNCKLYRDEYHIGSRGDGRKRLPRSDTVIGDFSLTKKHVQKGSGRPKFKKLEDTRNFISVNAGKEIEYRFDPKHFETTPKSLLITDLTTERLRLAKLYRQRRNANESMLNTFQQQSLDEILQIPVSKPPETSIGEHGGAILNDLAINKFDHEITARPIDHAARAILAVKNHNLLELEQVLDTEGVSVETRDQHGNSLFILACQQGSKKLAKFLLRRGADMNSQNNGGNTSLHYLYEYKFVSLAEYLVRKGANNSIKNGVGRTCYEGLDANDD